MTRHLIREYGLKSTSEEALHAISGIVPGVMAQTGMETSEIIEGVVEITKPDVVIAVDALAARSTRRLNRDYSDHRYRNYARVWCGKSQKWPYRRKFGK